MFQRTLQSLYLLTILVESCQTWCELWTLDDPWKDMCPIDFHESRSTSRSNFWFLFKGFPLNMYDPFAWRWLNLVKYLSKIGTLTYFQITCSKVKIKILIDFLGQVRQGQTAGVRQILSVQWFFYHFAWK